MLAARNGWLSPLPPEGASAIVHGGDTSHAAQQAESQGIGAGRLLADGIVDRVVPERPDAADEPEAFCRRLSAVVGEELRALAHADAGDRLARRLARLD